ncbi:hypothetical protein EG351_09655 [Chryseobacterium bernardetii]|nr:hypothetical protein EG351_09655 [Chryseobacterium bernardetii]
MNGQIYSCWNIISNRNVFSCIIHLKDHLLWHNYSSKIKVKNQIGKAFNKNLDTIHLSMNIRSKKRGYKATSPDQIFLLTKSEFLCIRIHKVLQK